MVMDNASIIRNEDEGEISMHGISINYLYTLIFKLKKLIHQRDVEGDHSIKDKIIQVKTHIIEDLYPQSLVVRSKCKRYKGVYASCSNLLKSLSLSKNDRSPYSFGKIIFFDNCYAKINLGALLTLLESMQIFYRPSMQSEAENSRASENRSEIHEKLKSISQENGLDFWHCNQKDYNAFSRIPFIQEVKNIQEGKNTELTSWFEPYSEEKRAEYAEEARSLYSFLNHG